MHLSITDWVLDSYMRLTTRPSSTSTGGDATRLPICKHEGFLLQMVNFWYGFFEGIGVILGIGSIHTPRSGISLRSSWFPTGTIRPPAVWHPNTGNNIGNTTGNTCPNNASCAAYNPDWICCYNGKSEWCCPNGSTCGVNYICD